MSFNAGSLPLLTLPTPTNPRSNYRDWSYELETLLVEYYLWDEIIYRDLASASPEYSTKNTLAVNFLAETVDDDVRGRFFRNGGGQSAATVWERIRDELEGLPCRRRMKEEDDDDIIIVEPGVREGKGKERQMIMARAQEEVPSPRVLVDRSERLRQAWGQVEDKSESGNHLQQSELGKWGAVERGGSAGPGYECGRLEGALEGAVGDVDTERGAAEHPGPAHQPLRPPPPANVVAPANSTPPPPPRPPPLQPHRYRPGIATKSHEPWTIEEETVLASYCTNFIGELSESTPKHWEPIASHLGRSGAAVRKRWRILRERQEEEAEKKRTKRRERRSRSAAGTGGQDLEDIESFLQGTSTNLTYGTRSKSNSRTLPAVPASQFTPSTVWTPFEDSALVDYFLKIHQSCKPTAKQFEHLAKLLGKQVESLKTRWEGGIKNVVSLGLEKMKELETEASGRIVGTGGTGPEARVVGRPRLGNDPLPSSSSSKHFYPEQILNKNIRRPQSLNPPRISLSKTSTSPPSQSVSLNPAPQPLPRPLKSGPFEPPEDAIISQTITLTKQMGRKFDWEKVARSLRRTVEAVQERADLLACWERLQEQRDAEGEVSEDGEEEELMVTWVEHEEMGGGSTNFARTTLLPSSNNPALASLTNTATASFSSSSSNTKTNSSSSSASANSTSQSSQGSLMERQSEVDHLILTNRLVPPVSSFTPGHSRGSGRRDRKRSRSGVLDLEGSVDEKNAKMGRSAMREEKEKPRERES